MLIVRAQRMSVLVSHVLWTGDNFGLVSMTLLVRHSDL